MYFRQVLHADRACASYLVGCPTRGVCAAIDPQGPPGAYVSQAEAHGMRIATVIDTHVHADHVSGARELAAYAGVLPALGPGADVRFPHTTLADGQIIEVGNRRIRVIHTPGHTPEHVCLLVDDWFALTGDTLFVGDVGRVDLTLGAPEPAALRERARALHASLHRLLALPDWTEVYPGHYAGSVCGRGMDGKPISTIGRERRANVPLGMDLQAFVAFQTGQVPPPPPDFEAIKRRNLGA
jgi:hydroxyacylglutathione hydrolase